MTDLILAPETPSRLRSGSKSSRKTDGVHIVGESPEMKQEGQTLYQFCSFQTLFLFTLIIISAIIKLLFVQISKEIFVGFCEIMNSFWITSKWIFSWKYLWCYCGVLWELIMDCLLLQFWKGVRGDCKPLWRYVDGRRSTRLSVANTAKPAALVHVTGRAPRVKYHLVSFLLYYSMNIKLIN